MTQVDYRYYRKRDSLPFGIKGNLSQYGGVTLAVTIGADTCQVGFAICSNKEKFNKAKGKVLARARLCDMPIKFTLKDVYDWLDDNSKGNVMTKKCMDRLKLTLTFNDLNKEVIYSYFIDALLQEATTKIMEH